MVWRCAGWREGCEVDGGGFAEEKLRHDVGGGGGEKDAVAVVAGGEEVVGLVGESAEEGKAVGCCGAKASPGFELGEIGERRQQRGREGVQVR